MATTKEITLNGPKSSLNISSDDPVAFKMAMLFEWVTRSSTSTSEEIAQKYGYTREHLYTVKRKFENSGSEGLRDKPSGPNGKSVRNEAFNKEIIRHKMLDPDASVKVVAQKMRQGGFSCSNKSVERAFTDLGLRKKTLRRKSP